MRTPWLYRMADEVSEIVLYFMVIFYPWAFGTTEIWSIRFMNGAGYGLGGLLLLKWLVRWRTGYVPPRWGDGNMMGSSMSVRHRTGVTMVRVLAWLTVGGLVYCLIAAVNARMVYSQEAGETYFTYLRYVAWLPHSYHQQGTWLAFWSYLGLGVTFWAVRDLLLGRSALERHRQREQAGVVVAPWGTLLPERLQRLLWVVCLNAGWLAVVSILQRMSGTDKLLWVMDRVAGYAPDFSFGPYAYRSNGAQFFNLVWPVCLGFWAWQRAGQVVHSGSEAHRPTGPHRLLLPLGMVMAACPLISASRGGSVLMLVAVPAVFALLVGASRTRVGRGLAAALVVLAVGLGLAAWLGAGSWVPNAEQAGDLLAEPPASVIAQQREHTRQMVADHPWLGVGPYAYKAVYHFYCQPGDPVYAFAHSDWRQTRVEWGALGLVLLLAALTTALILPVFRGTGGHLIVQCLWISLGVMLVHGSFDFPFQIQSLLFMFLLYLAALTSFPPVQSAGRPGPARPEVALPSGQPPSTGR
jgi:hypothetical protein